MFKPGERKNWRFLRNFVLVLAIIALVLCSYYWNEYGAHPGSELEYLYYNWPWMIIFSLWVWIRYKLEIHEGQSWKERYDKRKSKKKKFKWH